MIYAIYIFSRQWIKDSGHLEILHNIDPQIFSLERLSWFYQFPLYAHHLTILALLFLTVSFILGVHFISLRQKFKFFFTSAGITNGLGDTPKLVYKRRLDRYRVQFEFDSNGIGIKKFQENIDDLESLFKMEVESIKRGKHPGRAHIVFSTRKFPESITYGEISEEKVLKSDSFYVGLSPEGVVTQNISELPHMLVAGTTGGGKSVYFKQCLVGLLESTKNLQTYIIDLKGGLEAIDFKEAPNVKIIKDMNQALILLRKVDSEMKDRFKYLEQNGFKSIVPERDKKDRIIVAVDEASVLYMKRNRYDDDFKSSLEARQLADSICKLSRAAAIHLILATQKLDREVLPTSVSENISGRMAFRANSLQGSIVVLGNKDASELPEIPGRGIWNVGNKKTIVQSPFISDATIKKICKRIKNEFDAGERKLFTNMLDGTKKVVSKLEKDFTENF